MKRRLLSLIAIAAVFAATGCAPPVGYIGGASTAGADSLWAVPYRVMYDINDVFVRSEDLLVFGSRNGIVFSIPVEEVDIGIIDNPDSSDEVDEWFPKNGDRYLFRVKGRKVIVVRYGGMSTQYSIEVRDPYEIGDIIGPGEGGGIIVEWGDP